MKLVIRYFVVGQCGRNTVCDRIYLRLGKDTDVIMLPNFCSKPPAYKYLAGSQQRAHNRSSLNANGDRHKMIVDKSPTPEAAKEKVRENSRECHNHKPQPFPDPKRKRKPTNLNKHKPNKRTKSTKISSLFPKRANRNTKRTEKHKNKMTHGKTYNKSPRRINHKATKSKTNTRTTALERSVEQTTGGFKALLQLAYFTLGPDATRNTEIHKNAVRIKAPNSVSASKRKYKNQINHYNKQRRVLMANSTVCQSKQPSLRSSP